MTSRNAFKPTSFLVLCTVLGASFALPNTGCGASDEPQAAVSVRVTEYVTLADQVNPMVDAEVCETDTENCVMTGEDGMAMINLPDNAEVSYTITKEGYGSYLVSDVTDSRIEHWFRMYNDEEVERLAGLMGTTYPLDGGIILLRGYSDDPGVMFDLVGGSSNQFYFLTGDTPSTEIDSTTADGRGGFTDLADGVYEVDFVGAPVECRDFSSWPSEVANRVRVPVKDGYISYSSMSCGTETVP